MKRRGFDMDLKINGNLNTKIQNEYLQRCTQNVSSRSETKGERRAVLERNVGAYGKVANICYDKNEVYSGTSRSNANEAVEAVAGYNKENTMIQCIDILKNNVTPEDYSQLEAWGLIPDEDNPEAFVSVYERIQIELAAYCDNYDISGLNINTEKMENVLGSTSMANAVSKANDIAAEVSTLSDETKRYIMTNDMEPTLSNVYKAIHSITSDNTYNVLGDESWNQLKGQVESFFNTNGIEVNSENLDNAKWIISSELPLTVDNFEKLCALSKIDFSSETYLDNLKQNISYNIYFGGNGMSTDVTGNAFDMEKVKEAVDTVKSAMDQDVDYILKNNKKLNIENLKLRIEERKKEENKSDLNKDNTYTKKSVILAEARAILTAGSLFMMQKAGVSISYTEITVMVDMSHAANESFADRLFALDNYVPEDNERELLTKTVEVMSGFSTLPINVAASIYNEEIDYTPKAVYDEGLMLASRYKMASLTYEAVGTEVRKDLGDSISKAFRNVDELLTACGVELNEENRRAARVLGHNSMEITVESVDVMVGITTQLDELTRNLTPRAAMHLIKNGINPLETNIVELNQMLVKLNEELYAGDENERYSEYLWKLEKNKSITKQERDAYIQMYRIINQINKQDGSVVGAVKRAGRDMTLSNLYSAVKTRYTGSVDKKIDDSTGLFDGTYSEDALTRYLNDTMAIIKDDGLHSEYIYESMQRKLETMTNLQTMSEEEFMRYISGNEGTSINNIYSAIIASNKNLYRKLVDLNDDKIENAANKISDTWQQDDDKGLDDAKLEQSIVEGYEMLNDSIKTENVERYFDRAMARNDMHNAIRFMTSQAKNRSYYIPMEISGEKTMVHMTIKNGTENEKGRISVYTEIEDGKVSVLMKAKEDGYDTLAATDSLTLKEKLEKLLGEDAKVVYTEKVTDGMWNEAHTSGDENKEVSYGELVRQAKSFIHNVLNKC